MNKVILMTITVLCVSCSSRRTVVSTQSTSRDSIFVQKLVPVTLPSDTADVNALLRCDSLGRVYIADIDALTSENIALRFRLDSLGNLRQRIIVRHDTVFVPATHSENRITAQTSNDKVSESSKSGYISLFVIIGFLILIIIILIKIGA